MVNHYRYAHVHHFRYAHVDESHQLNHVMSQPQLSLITSRFVNGNTVRNFPTHGQLSAAQGSTPLFQL
jgi:hypothetical protein